MNKALFVLGPAMLLSALNLWGQATASGTLQGTVFDSSKAVVPNADVSVSSAANGLKRSEKSGADGSYRFNQLPADTYEVTVKAAGFATEKFPKVALQVAISTELNITLSAGAQSDLVTVDASAPIVDVTKTEVGMAITPVAVETLPLNGRDFANLAFLAPGAKPVNSYDPTKARIAVFAVSGSGGRNVNVTVNGIDDKDNTVGGPVMQLPLEAVQEFNISTQRFSAANGRSEGAAINLVTKSGTNNYHGALFLFDRDTVLNANDYISKQGNQPTSPYSRQQYGGSFGTPIVKDKTFAYFAIERQREQSNTVVNNNAYDNLVAAAPLGAQPVHNIPTPYNDQRYTGRLDHRFSPGESFFVTYNSQSNRGLNDQAGATNDLTAGNFTTNQLILANATLNSVLTPSVVNSFTAGYQYWNNLIDSNNKVPYLLFPSAAFGTNPNVPQQSIQKKWQFRDDFSWNKGKHSFKTGFDFVNMPFLGGFFQTPSTLGVTFIDDPLKILSDPVKYPQGFKTAGAVQSMSASSGNSYFRSANAKMLGFYFQDDWKVSRRLSIDIGIRWDKDFDLTGGDTEGLSRTYLALKAVNSPYAAGIVKNDNKDFSPRFGFAYDVTGSGHHVIRGGYGIYYGQIFQNIPLFTEQQEGSTVFTQVLNVTSTGPGDLKSSVVPGTGGILLGNYRYGVDPLPAIPPASANLPANATGRLVNPGYRNPYNQEWNLGYSLQLTPNDVIEFEGIHSLALRESKRVNINYKDPVTGVRVYDNAFVAAGLPKLAQIVVESSIGRSRYDAFNVVYTHRLSRRFSVNTNYVRSRALGYDGASAGFSNTAPNPTNLFDKNSLGPTPSDEPNRWVLSSTYEGPWGFRISPIVQWASGRPWNATEGITDIYGYGGGNGTWRAVVPTSSPTAYTATAGLNAAQLVAGLANGSLMTLPYDAFRGNAFFQWDLRGSKTFKLGEHQRVEFICQMFDMTNRANFGTNYTASIRSTNFAKPSNFLSTSGTVVPHAFEAEMGFRYSF
jgi:hypothetical protein